MGGAFCFCDKNEQNLIKGDINLIENQQDNNNKIKANLNDKKNPESCTYSNSNHRNENENENEQENEIDDNVEENEEENNEENENNSNQEEKHEESEIKDENKNINDNNTNHNNEKKLHTEVEKLQNINIFKEKMQPYVKIITENEYEEAIPNSLKNIEKNLEELDQNHEKIQQIINSLDQQTNITYPSLLINENKQIYTGMWNISGVKEGYGILLDAKGNKYQGGFLDDYFEGYGRLISIEGDWYEGDWKNGVIEGKGKYYCKKEDYWTKILFCWSIS